MTPRRLKVQLAAALVLAALGCMSSEERIANHLERARVYEESSQPNQALVELQSALRLDPQNAETNYLTGELMTQMERYDDAIFFYEEAHRIDPKRDDAKLGIAFLLRFNDADRAEKLVEEVLAHSPKDVSAHLLRSDIYLARADVNGALASALTAVEFEPNSTRAALQVGMARRPSSHMRTRPSSRSSPSSSRRPTRPLLERSSSLSRIRIRTPWCVAWSSGRRS